jgi:hypothetical protein
MIPITLSSDRISVDIDPGRGADILQITHTATGVGILASTPWRTRADSIRDGAMAPSSVDPTARWLEQYRGGWQTLCPSAGPPRRVGEVEVGFHGEASVAAWTVEAAAPDRARLSLELFSVPVRIDREIRVHEDSVTQSDVLTNLGGEPIVIDYVSHPAFGGAFLDGVRRVETGAGSFTTDPDEAAASPEEAASASSAALEDLRRMPPPGEPARAFGWLSDFETGWYSLRNDDLGLEVRVEWDARTLPHAWFWQELNASAGHPWFRRARIMAIEPSSTTTSGPGRAASLTLRPSAATPIAITLELSSPTARRTPTKRGLDNAADAPGRAWIGTPRRPCR